jgi:hypothetical protein
MNCSYSSSLTSSVTWDWANILFLFSLNFVIYFNKFDNLFCLSNLILPFIGVIQIILSFFPLDFSITTIDLRTDSSSPLFSSVNLVDSKSCSSSAWASSVTSIDWRTGYYSGKYLLRLLFALTSSVISILY